MAASILSMQQVQIDQKKEKNVSFNPGYAKGSNRPKMSASILAMLKVQIDQNVSFNPVYAKGSKRPKYIVAGEMNQICW